MCISYVCLKAVGHRHRSWGVMGHASCVMRHEVETLRGMWRSWYPSLHCDTWYEIDGLDLDAATCTQLLSCECSDGWVAFNDSGCQGSSWSTIFIGIVSVIRHRRRAVAFPFIKISHSAFPFKFLWPGQLMFQYQKSGFSVSYYYYESMILILWLGYDSMILWIYYMMTMTLTMINDNMRYMIWYMYDIMTIHVHITHHMSHIISILFW